MMGYYGNPYSDRRSVQRDDNLDFGSRTLYAEAKFRAQVETTVETIQRLPKLRVNVIQRMYQW